MHTYWRTVVLTDLTLCPMPMISLPSFFILLTNSMGSMPLSNALLNCFAAASSAPPKRSPCKVTKRKKIYICSWLDFLQMKKKMKCINKSQLEVSYDGEEARGEAGDKIFASSGTHNSVVGPRNSRAVISSHHQAHLYELAGILGQPAHKWVMLHSGYVVQGILKEFFIQIVRLRCWPPLEPQQP